MDLDKRIVLAYEHVLVERGERPICEELFAAVGGVSAGRQHFDHENRILDRDGVQVERFWSACAGDQHIGIVIGIRFGHPQANVIDEDAARRAAQVRTQGSEQIAGDQVMAQRAARHGEQLAAHVLVLDRALRLQAQVFVFR
jgi:hypothetical protein